MKDATNRTSTAMFRNRASFGFWAFACLLVAGCYGEVDAGPAYYPPDSFVAVGQPVYYEGHASYFYNGRWVYRDAGGRWNAYRSEPAFLAQRRAAVSAPRRTYERPSQRAPARR
jgi:hypothetical protein